MNIRDEYIVALGLILLIVMAFTLFNIFSFMPKEKKCEPAFWVIKKCNCIPDQYIAKLFDKNIYSVYINASEGANGS